MAADRRMIEWQRVPWSLWAYVALSIGGDVIHALIVSMPVASLILIVVVSLAWNFFLLKGLRWLWIAMLVVFSVTIAVDFAIGNYNWYGDTIGLVELGLLLMPATRRFFGAVKPAVAA